MWPYHVRRFRRRPAPHCFHIGRSRYRAIAYYPDSARDRRICAPAWRGVSVRDGARLYTESMMGRQVRRTGLVPVPARHDPLRGGHAVLASATTTPGACDLPQLLGRGVGRSWQRLPAVRFLPARPT